MSEKPSEADAMEFLRAARNSGASDEFVVALLRQNGWSERRIFRAYSAFYATQTGMPIPARHLPAENARDAFYYLLNFITLGFWTVALGQIFYIVIAQRFPDALEATNAVSLRDRIAWQVATVIVAFPIFLFVHNLIGKELRARADLYDSAVRKWLTYIALVIAAFMVLSDAVWFVEAVIREDITTRFVLDSLVLLVLGGGVFSYYLRTMDAPAVTE